MCQPEREVQPRLPYEISCAESKIRTCEDVQCALSPISQSPASKVKSRRTRRVQKSESESTELQPVATSQEETIPLNALSGIKAPLQRVDSWGESSLDQLFKQIDEIEGDFSSIVASLPSAEQAIGSLKSSSNKNTTLDNAGSFESNPSTETTTTDVLRMQHSHIKDNIEIDDGACGSQGEMSHLILRLGKAATELRTLKE